MNCRGQMVLVELLFYVLCLVIVLALVFYSFDYVDNSQVAFVENSYMVSGVDDLSRILTTTSGTPTYWDRVDSSRVRTVGLCVNDSSDVISYDKILKLKSNNSLMEGLIPSGYKYCVSIYPEGHVEDRMLIAGDYIGSGVSVESRDVPVVVDFGFNYSRFTGGGSCPMGHDDGWKCMPLNVNRSLLSGGHYYILSNSSAEFVVSNTSAVSSTSTCSGRCDVTNIFNSLVASDNDTLYIHLHSNKNDSYIVYDANNRSNFLDSVRDNRIYIITVQLST